MRRASIYKWADYLRTDNVESAHDGGKEEKGSKHNELHDWGVRRWGFLEEGSEEETGWVRIFIWVVPSLRPTSAWYDDAEQKYLMWQRGFVPTPRRRIRACLLHDSGG